MKLSVPYYSQFIDVEDSFWMLRACGAVCFKMVTEFHGAKVSSIVEFCHEAKETGGYDMHNGWIHNYLVNKAEGLGLKAHRTERDLPIVDEIIASLEAGNPVIVSVEKRVLEQKRFHMLVIVGYEGGDTSSPNEEFQIKPAHGFYYHEPESTDRTRGAYRFCDVETFKEYWRGKAISISKVV